MMSMTDEKEPPHPLTSPTVRHTHTRQRFYTRKGRPKPNSKTADEKSESEQEGHIPSVHVLDQPDKWCIYRVPSKLRNVNEAAYTPQLLSIGPFHHGKPELKDMEEHKEIYYENFCARFSKSKPELKQFIEDRQKQTLCCYAGTIELDIVPELDIDSVLVDIILVDACFITELFLVNSEKNHKNDYILRSPWLKKAIEQDLMLFENQLPYSLLQELYDFVTPPSSNVRPTKGQAQDQTHRHSSTDYERSQNHSIDIKAEHFFDHPFHKLTCGFFGYSSEEKSVKDGEKLKHFTDLVRSFLCPEQEIPFEDHSLRPPRGPTKNIYAVKQLRAAGVKFRPLDENDQSDEKDNARFVIKVDAKILTLACFRNMDLKLTQFRVKDDTECMIRNVMAMEQFLYPDEAYICNYFLLMDELVDTVEDVNFLVESKVIVNMLGSNKAVAKLINSLCDHIMEDKSCYVNVGKQLNDHYENFWNRHVATLRQVYFKDLWTGSATIVGICVVVLSITLSLKTIISGRKLCFIKKTA